MKRICSDFERDLLFKNRNQMLQGIYQTKAKGKFSNIFLGLFFSIIIMFAGIFFLIDILGESKIYFYIWVIICFTIPNSIVSFIMGKIRVRKEAKAFLKKKNLMINGATIVEVDSIRKSFSYMEDDFLDEKGEPIILDYPELPIGFDESVIGKRILVMYENDSSFQLMVLNDDLCGLIPNYSIQYPLNKEIKEYKRLPHPDAANIQYEEHTLSESEKEKFADMYVKATQRDAFKVIKICCIIIFTGVMVFCVFYGLSEGMLLKTVLYGLAGCAGYGLFLCLIRIFGKWNIKRKTKFVSVKEVMFHSNVIEQFGKRVSTELKVYEWERNRFERNTYPNGSVSVKTKYGSILYKLVNEKGIVFFINKEGI